MNDVKAKTCCFSGHRRLPLDSLNIVKESLESNVEALIQNGYIYFGTGGALGFDTIAAQIILKLKEKYSHIKLILVLPCINQTKGWKKDDVEIYESIKKSADKVVYTSDDYLPGCMQIRNQHLVNYSSVCICYKKNETGGTAYTVNYAKEKGLQIINIANL